MSITVLAPAYYTSLHPVRYLDQSAKRHGIDVHWYGLGKPYTGWYDVQIIDLLEELSKVTTSHVLYADGSDSIFTASLTEIEDMYKHLNCPPVLLSRERSGICAGGILAEVDALVDKLEFLALYRPFCEDPDNPQVRWRTAVTAGLVEVAIDGRSHIFQVMDEALEINEYGLMNVRTNTSPCILHFAGGYTDPVIGKAAQIEPYWERLGYA